MSALAIIFVIVLAALIVGTFMVADRVDEILNGVGQWTADPNEKTARDDLGGGRGDDERPSEPSIQTNQLN